MHWKYNSGSGYRQKQTKEQINTKPKPPNDCKMTVGTYTTVSLASCLDTLEIADSASCYTYKFMEVSSPCGRYWSPTTVTNTCTVLLNIALKFLKYWHNKVSTHYSHICQGLYEAICILLWRTVWSNFAPQSAIHLQLGAVQTQP